MYIHVCRDHAIIIYLSNLVNYQNTHAVFNNFQIDQISCHEYISTLIMKVILGNSRTYWQWGIFHYVQRDVR